MKIKFRPHHFLCAFCYRGKGYSSEFTANFTTIVEYLRSDIGDDAVVEIVNETDSVCAPCPHRRAKLCETQEKIVRLDEAHARMLAIQSGEKITWGDAKKRIREKVTPELFHSACAPCEWKKLGICEEIIFKCNI